MNDEFVSFPIKAFDSLVFFLGIGSVLAETLSLKMMSNSSIVLLIVGSVFLLLPNGYLVKRLWAEKSPNQ